VQELVVAGEKRQKTKQNDTERTEGGRRGDEAELTFLWPEIGGFVST